jgi:thioesterase domain-containing protein
MLLPIQTSGEKPPLFFVHGLNGVMPLGRTFADGLGPDYPLYAVNANGMDGQAPAINSMRNMVLAYVDEIQKERPTGCVVIGGMCDGSLAAIEVARELQTNGRQVGPVILADPLTVPRRIGGALTVDVRQSEVARQLYKQVQSTLLSYSSSPNNHLPFDSSDPHQIHSAVLAGVATLAALAGYTPSPFSGPVQLIISAERSASFFHPQMPWHKLLPGPRMVLVVPWKHTELFQSGRVAVARALRFLLDEAPAFEALGESRAETDAPAIEPLSRRMHQPATQQVQ